MLNLMNLDDRTRECMLEELAYSLEQGQLYVSPRLSACGKSEWPDLLRTALEKYDDSWLADQISSNERLHACEMTSRGTRKVPRTAPITLAEGEFNRFYIRGLCLRAIKDHLSQLTIYRAKNVKKERSESQLIIEETVDPIPLLHDLRDNEGVDTVLGIPSGPNSSLTIRLP